MRKALIVLLGTAVLLALAIGCTSTSAPSPTAAVPKTQASPTKAAVAPTAAAAPTAPAKGAAAATTKELAKVKLGVVTGISDAAFFIANDKGYFKEQGLEVQMTPFNSAAQMVAPLSIGQLDAGGGAPGAGLYNAMAREITVKIVADKGSFGENDSYQALLVRKDLVDSGKFKDYKDLKGLKIAIPAEGITPHVELDAALKKGGLTLKDADTVVMPFPEMPAAFAGKSIDAAVSIEPFSTLAVQKGVAVKFKGSNEYYPNHQVAVVLYSPAFIKDRPDVAKRFMVAYLKAARDYNDAFVKKDKKAWDDVVGILMKNTSVKDKALYEKMPMPGINPNGDVMIQSLKDDQEWYLAKGYQKTRINIDSLVDQQFIKYAVQQLGVYK